MNRKQFITSVGATCKNWTWSWSFVNHEAKIVIFGVWEEHLKSDYSLILDEQWEHSDAGKKQPGYIQALEHIDLVDNQKYRLKIFPQTFSNAHQDDEGRGPAKLDGFKPELLDRSLLKIGGGWFAVSQGAPFRYAEEISDKKTFPEGSKTTVSVNAYERNPEARRLCLDHYGFKCQACDFDFEGTYGELGAGYIHVHHITPLSEIQEQYEINPIEDLIPLCPNCHAMAHKASPPLKVEQLRSLIQNMQDGKACSPNLT